MDKGIVFTTTLLTFYLGVSLVAYFSLKRPTVKGIKAYYKQQRRKLLIKLFPDVFYEPIYPSTKEVHIIPVQRKVEAFKCEVKLDKFYHINICEEDVMNMIRREMAMKLGEELLSKGFIEFTGEKEQNFHFIQERDTTRIIARLEALQPVQR